MVAAARAGPSVLGLEIERVTGIELPVVVDTATTSPGLGGDETL